jgi:hypothetical protein
VVVSLGRKELASKLAIANQALDGDNESGLAIQVLKYHGSQRVH